MLNGILLGKYEPARLELMRELCEEVKMLAINGSKNKVREKKKIMEETPVIF
jgi:hypothetical protein